MSYAAGRWARAHTLVLDRDSTALAVLKELADDFRDNEGRCRIESYKDLALCLGIKKPATVSEAVSRLSALGLVRASNILSGRCVVGTRFELIDYRKDDWPETRQGKGVWVEVARARGIEPESWWPAARGLQKTDDPQKKGVPRKTDDLRKTDDGAPKNGIGVPRKTDEGYSEKRNPFTGDRQGITGNRQGVVDTPDSAGVPEVSEAENPHLDTNPSLAQFDGVPFPDFEEASDDELFAAELIKADKAKSEPAPEPEAKPKARTRKATAKKADVWPVEDDGVDAETREAYLSVRKAKRVGPFTPKAYEQLAKQATKHGVSVKVALEKCIESGWVFPYDSLFEKEKNHGKTQQSQQKSAFLRPQSEIDYTYGLDRWNRV